VTTPADALARSDTNEGDARRTLAAVRELGPRLRDARDEIDEARTLPTHVVEWLREAGVWRMTQPRVWGGPELDVLAQFEIIEAVSIAEGSAGWCSYIGSTAGFWNAWIDQDVARAMYPSLDLPTGGSPMPRGRAERVDGGYLLTGRWPFGSGVKHSAWMVSGGVVHDGGEPVMGDDGLPETVVGFLPVDELTVDDRWETTGLRGTGSYDYMGENLFLPAERTFVLFKTAPRRPGPLYAYPGMLLFNHCAVALGIARAAVDEFATLATARRNVGGRLIAEEDYGRSAIAHAEALVRSARSYCVEVMNWIWDSLERGEELTPTQRAHYRLMISYAHTASVEAVELVFHAAGTAAIQQSGVLDRCMRDILTANQHLVASPRSYQTAGKVLLGFEADDPSF
jgi:alkylation response protein AidB-like acyl-CoA dehydrogenase